MKPFIKAHELRQWGFCPRQWYLTKISGHRPWNDSIKRGLEYHRVEGAKIEKVCAKQKNLKILILAGGVCLFFLFLLLSGA